MSMYHPPSFVREVVEKQLKMVRTVLPRELGADSCGEAVTDTHAQHGQRGAKWV